MLTAEDFPKISYRKEKSHQQSSVGPLKQAASTSRAPAGLTQTSTHLQVQKGRSSSSWRPMARAAGSSSRSLGHSVKCRPIYSIVDLVASALTHEHISNFTEGPAAVKGIFQQRIYQSLGLSAHLGWARLLIDRSKEHIKRSIQQHSRWSRRRRRRVPARRLL